MGNQGIDPMLEIHLLNIHNALLTTQAIMLSPDLTDEERLEMYKLALAQIKNNDDYQKTLYQVLGYSQNQHGPERKE